MSLDAGEGVFISRADEGVFGGRQCGNGLLRVRERISFVAKASLGPGQLNQELGILRLSTQQVVHGLLCFLISHRRFGGVAGVSLQIA